jgi:hypothetical protein
MPMCYLGLDLKVTSETSTLAVSITSPASGRKYTILRGVAMTLA